MNSKNYEGQRYYKDEQPTQDGGYYEGDRPAHDKGSYEREQPKQDKAGRYKEGQARASFLALVCLFATFGGAMLVDNAFAAEPASAFLAPIAHSETPASFVDFKALSEVSGHETFGEFSIEAGFEFGLEERVTENSLTFGASPFGPFATTTSFEFETGFEFAATFDGSSPTGFGPFAADGFIQT